MTNLAMISIESVSGWVTILVIIGAAWMFRRGGGGTAIVSLEIANRVLEKRVLQLEQQAKHDAALIAELKARTDLSVQLQPIVKWTGDHERHDQERFDHTLTILDRIAGLLDTSTKEQP